MNKSSTSIHPAAESGFTAGARDYVRGRPDYPAELSGWLREQLGLQPGSTVVDLGAGTGKFTPRLLATGARVIAVEPVASMRAELSAAFPQVEALEGTAESIPLPDESVNAVVCAQAFHWFATPTALAEIHRVLKPGGVLGLVWNLRDERVNWVARLEKIVNQGRGDTPYYHSGEWRRAFPVPGFGALHEQHFDAHNHTGTPEDVILNRARSTSFIAAMKPEDRAAIDVQLKALIAAEPALSGKETVTVPYTTAAFYTVKTG